MAVSAPNVELHIGELLLEGFPPAERHHIGDALARELTRLLTEEGVPPSLASFGEGVRIDAGQFRSEGGAEPDQVGAQIARSVYGGLAR
ncbi:MAG TPA: hypothetical protein VFA21_19125 [Pyrinomonadaceae bacterium]|jgi:hypothetical protein|nr:hypothetical protein [Pyrinomonadaceae bacterium]